MSIDDDAADDVSVRFGSGAYSVAEGASVSVTVTTPERVLAVPIVVVSTVDIGEVRVGRLFGG